jgi:predicted TIM-barrel fold metal-dependent hydrolase
LGFELAVAFAPFDAEKVHATSRALPGQDPIRWLADGIRPYNNIVGFATIDLNGADACAQVEQALKLGLRGIKVHPLICQLDIADRRHDPFYELAEEHSLPVIVHCGHGRWPWPVRYASPLLVEEVACRFPKLSFIIAHCGGAGFFRETMLALQSAPNCYADLALVFGRGAGWYVPADELRRLVGMGLARKLIYGLDYPWGAGEQVRLDLHMTERWPIEDEVRAGIFGGTIASLMGLNRQE